jgi:NAD(P) transhydrogenase subunit alpha
MMTVQLTVLKEEQASETRVAASPETVKKLKAMGVSVTVEAGAGAKSGFDDNDFKQAGAAVTKAIAASLKKADVVVSVRAPSPAKIKSLKPDAVVIGQLNPYQNAAGVKAMASQKVQAMSMELMPRITRAQSMDVLSSQSNLAGYKAVLDATAEYNRALPTDDRGRHGACGAGFRHGGRCCRLAGRGNGQTPGCHCQRNGCARRRRRTGGKPRRYVCDGRTR